MKTIYMIRHQHHGIVTSHAFASKPTAAQIAPIIADLETRHAPAIMIGELAALHPADPNGSHKIPEGSPPWVALVEVSLFDAAEVPKAFAPKGVDGRASGIGKVG